jgi:hypothetical protein
MLDTEWVQEDYHLPIGDFTLVDNRDPESFLLKKEKINALSREAKFLITLIFLEAFIEIGRITMSEIDSLLNMMGWSNRLVKKTKAEIRKFLNEY